MVWDLINTVLQAGLATLHFWMALLPASPLFLSSADVSAVAGIMGYAAWFLPVPAMAVTFGLFIVGVMTWVGVLLVKQLIEAALP